MTYKIGDKVKIQTPRQKDEIGTVINLSFDDPGYFEVRIDSPHRYYYDVWFKADGTEYRPRYGSQVIGKVEAELA